MSTHDGTPTGLPTGYDRFNPTAEPPATPGRNVEAARALVRIDAEHQQIVGPLRLARAVGLLDRRAAAVLVDASRRRARGAAGAVMAGLAVLALTVIAVAAAPAPKAMATEAPQPDPTPVAVYQVVDTAHPVVAVKATTSNLTPAGLHCASVWATTPRVSSNGSAHLGSACSTTATVTVRVVLDGAALPLGRSTVTITDDVAPMNTTPARAVLDVRRASRFGVGTWTDAGQGYLTVAASLQAYSPAAGRWLPQQAPSKVQVQMLVGRTWRVVAMFTARSGVVYGTVHLTPGPNTVRVAHLPDQGSWATYGVAHRFDLNTEPVVD